jgi:hypothetical protein
MAELAIAIVPGAICWLVLLAIVTAREPSNNIRRAARAADQLAPACSGGRTSMAAGFGRFRTPTLSTPR